MLFFTKLKLSFQASSAFFKDAKKPMLKKQKKPYFESTTQQKANQATTNNAPLTQQQIQAMDEINQLKKMDTKYTKYYFEDSFNNCLNYTGRNINDLPFQFNQHDLPQKSPTISKLTSHILQKMKTKDLNSILKYTSSNYFSDLFLKTRKIAIQPNFQRQARRTISSLISKGYKLSLGKLNQNFQVHMLDAHIFKGIQVIRNNNYSVNSYKILQQDNYTFYQLWRQGVYKIPQIQWNKQLNLLLQLKTLVQTPWDIQIKSPSGEKLQTKGKSHIFTFQMNLKRPPKFSEFRFTQPAYLKMYQLNFQNLTITNVDDRNPYKQFIFQENQKKRLINKLV